MLSNFIYMLNDCTSNPLTVESLQFRGSDTLVTFRGDDGTVWKKSYAIPPAWQLGNRILAALNTENGVFFPNE